MFDWFSSKTKTNFIEVDVHSHLLPGLDDGVKTLDESISIIKEMHELGINKIITTPHIIHDYYPNTPEGIEQALATLVSSLDGQNMTIDIKSAAEYFVDENFFAQVNANEDFLTFGDNHLLIETGFMNKPIFFEEMVFTLKSNGYKPVLAHPERYIYLQEDEGLVNKLIDIGLLFQINVTSLTGYYSKAAKKLATYLIKNGMIHLLGSDIHNRKQLQAYKKAMKLKIVQECRQLPLINYAL